MIFVRLEAEKAEENRLLELDGDERIEKLRICKSSVTQRNLSDKMKNPFVIYAILLAIFLIWCWYGASHDKPSPAMRARLHEKARQDMDDAIARYKETR